MFFSKHKSYRRSHLADVGSIFREDNRIIALKLIIVPFLKAGRRAGAAEAEASAPTRAGAAEAEASAATDKGRNISKDKGCRSWKTRREWRKGTESRQERRGKDGVGKEDRVGTKFARKGRGRQGAGSVTRERSRTEAEEIVVEKEDVCSQRQRKGGEEKWKKMARV